MMDIIFTPRFQAQFWMKVKRVRENGCWEWQGKKTGDGYGVAYISNGPNSAAHRVAFTLLKEPIPEGMMLDHLCRNHSCVNPGHLEIVDNRENVVRGYAARPPKPQATHCRKGHPFDGDNVYMHGGHRRCRTCRDALEKRRGAARKAGVYVPKVDRASYQITSPDGEVFITGNMTQFCRERGLLQTGLSHVLSGKQRTYKGWTIQRIEEGD